MPAAIEQIPDDLDGAAFYMTVIRAVPVPVPPVAPPPPPQEGFVVVLNDGERAQLLRGRSNGPGGFQSRYRQFADRLDAGTGTLLLTDADLGWIWRQASRPWKGGWQLRTRKVFWRALAGVFVQLGLEPDPAPVAIAPDGRPRNRVVGPRTEGGPPRPLRAVPRP